MCASSDTQLIGSTANSVEVCERSSRDFVVGRLLQELWFYGSKGRARDGGRDRTGGPDGRGGKLFAGATMIVGRRTIESAQ